MSPGRNRGIDQIRGYNDRGDLYQVVEGQRVTDIDYDRSGRPTKTIRTVAPGSRYTELRTYHPYGALKERILEAIETDVSGATQDLKWVYAHDDGQRVNKVTFPGGDIQTTTYDSYGRPREVKDGAIEQRFTYDAYGNLETLERGPSGDVATETRYYDGYERLIRVDDAAGHARTMTYTNDDVVSGRTTYQNTALNGVLDSFVANTVDVLGRVTNWTEGGRASFQLVPEALRAETTGPRGAKLTERWLASGQIQEITLAEQFGTNVYAQTYDYVASRLAEVVNGHPRWHELRREVHAGPGDGFRDEGIGLGRRGEGDVWASSGRSFAHVDDRPFEPGDRVVDAPQSPWRAVGTDGVERGDGSVVLRRTESGGARRLVEPAPGIELRSVGSDGAKW